MRIVLATLNARYGHAALGLRCLLANMGELRPQCALVEGVIQDDPERFAERIAAHRPDVVGLSVSIWNRTPSLRVVRLLRAACPQARIVLGGPEATHAPDDDPLVREADCVVAGEGDLAFAELCRAFRDGHPLPRRLAAAKPDLALARLPFEEYDANDLATRLISVEATRGCVYSCEFCLSSLEKGVRGYPLPEFLAGIDRLIARGCRTFRFVDRTFNLDPRRCEAILRFFLDRWPRDAQGRRIGSRQAVDGGPDAGAFFLHFEMVPDRLIAPLRELLPQFPEGGVQLEIGIQSLDEQVNERISRRQSSAVALENLRWLRAHTGCHLHVDLIAGLPGETFAGFLAGFDRLYPACLDPAHGRAADLQVGILKLLPGTPLARHVDAFGMRFDPEPPYTILSSDALDFATLMTIKRLARWVELTANSHRFDRALAALVASSLSPSAAFLGLSAFLSRHFGREHGIPEPALYEAVALHLRGCGVDPMPLLAADFLDSRPPTAAGRKGVPEFLRAAVSALEPRDRVAHAR